MNTDEKLLKALEDLRADVKTLNTKVDSVEQGQKALETGQKALQDDVTAIKSETAKIPGIEQRLDHHGKLLTGLTATTATVLEEQQAQRMDIRSLHTEVHESTDIVATVCPTPCLFTAARGSAVTAASRGSWTGGYPL